MGFLLRKPSKSSDAVTTIFWEKEIVLYRFFAHVPMLGEADFVPERLVANLAGEGALTVVGATGVDLLKGKRVLVNKLNHMYNCTHYGKCVLHLQSVRR